ncbi:Protein kinase, putative [Hondaea fermentalgiana]|uniref:Protein kinase, putative n=1 Tax=Hondaea fermentalgiana TaxID=2315210 RepID=A0A2R5GN39_9STRA|nr:Protein kinase, putative [Hondaea fermentalgiana]|eukprot:GBG31148.1 Protein kinase, putative [Hondaea fermentalgiana]
MDAISGVALVVQLARDGASLLEDAVVCKRKTAHLKTVLEQFASRLKQHATGIDATQLEAELRDLLDLLKPYFGDNARRRLAAKAQEVISFLQENPNIDINAVLEGQLGTRHQRRAIERLTRSLVQAEELEAASLSSDQAFIKAPLQVLGEGQFGQVVLGVFQRDDGSEVETAIKRVKPNGRRMQFREQQALMREAASWNGLEHANIVCLLGTCIIENRFHLVMDKCDMSLDDLLCESEADAATLALSLDEKEAVLRGIARGLEYLHGNLIVHRDLKPANVMLSRDVGLVKLADFGLATQVEANSSIADTITSVGTPAYMAPEVLQAPIRWTTRADIYAFGIVMGILVQELKVGKEIVAAMREHLKNESVQTNACAALWNLAVSDRNKEILGQELKVGKEIVAAMREHLTSKSVQINACAAIWGLAYNDRNQEILGQELKVGKEIIAAMGAHPRSETVQKNACGALWNLAFNSSKYCTVDQLVIPHLQF